MSGLNPPQISRSSLEEKSRGYLILSIDGGGIRSVIPALLLDEIEKRVSKSSPPSLFARELFDLVAGTSTGG